MKTFNFEIDDCFEAACKSFSEEMGVCKKTDSDTLNAGLNRNVQLNKLTKKKKMSFYEKIEIACLLILVKIFI